MGISVLFFLVLVVIGVVIGVAPVAVVIAAPVAVAVSTLLIDLTDISPRLLVSLGLS